MADKKDFIVRSGLTVSTNATINTAITVGNSSVNTVVNSTSVSTSNLIVSTIVANGSTGSANQVLTTNGSIVYWANTSGGFTNGQSISVNALAITGAVTANGSTGTADQVLTTNGTGVYWAQPAATSNTTSVFFQYTGDGSNTTFGVAGGYQPNTVTVYINGALLRRGADVDVSSGTHIIFTEAPPNGSLIDVVGIAPIFNAGISAPVTQQFVANGTANSFTVTNGYAPNTALVFLNGVKQLPGTDVNTSSGNTVNFVVTPANGYVIDVYAYQTAIVSSGNVLTVGNTTLGLNQLTIGNTSANVTINSTSLAIGTFVITSSGVGLANNANYLNGNTASDLQTYADNKAGNAYSNAVSYVDSSSRTVSGNINFTGTNTYFTSGFSTGSNTATIGTSTYFVSNGNIGIGTNSPAVKLAVNGQINDVAGNIRSIPQNSQTSAYVLVASDNGKHISITTGGVTVPAGVFSVGDTVTIYNNSAAGQTITQGANATMYLVGTATTGNRTLAQRGLATVVCVASNTFVITGGGLT